MAGSVAIEITSVADDAFGREVVEIDALRIRGQTLVDAGLLVLTTGQAVEEIHTRLHGLTLGPFVDADEAHGAVHTLGAIIRLIAR